MRKIDLYLLLKNREHVREVRANQVSRSLGWLARMFVAVFSIILISSLFLAGLSVSRFTQDLPSIEILPTLLDREKGQLLQPTRVLDRSGKLTLFTYSDGDSLRKFLAIDPQAKEHISPQLIRSVIAAFDPTFWSNPGYDLKQWNNPEPQTIAERLVSDLILWNEPVTITRGIRMRMLAGQVVSRYGRTSVLEWYLNSAWFGRYAFGAEAASRLYLGKSAQDLTLAEAALLTSTLRSPALNPLDAPQTALDAQQAFLKEMLAGSMINQQEFKLAIQSQLQLRSPADQSPSIAEGFIRQVEKQLEPAMGHQRLQRGGLTIQTTLDGDLQQQLVCTTTSQLIRIQYSNISGVAPETSECQAAYLLPTQSFAGLNLADVAAGGLIMDPGNGEILAYLEPLSISGERLNDSGYHPGSLLTPIVAFSAFSRGYSPASLLWDVPPVNKATSTKGQSAVAGYHGPVNIRSALANNYLNPMTTLINEIGARNIWQSGVIIGITSLQDAPEDASPLYGGKTTSLFQVGTAYSIFANSGTHSGRLDAFTKEILPETVLKVSTASGSLIYEKQATAHAIILSEALAYLINNVLSDESARWPSLGYPNELEVGSVVAAKTGSADDHQQVWTVGYTPYRMILIWMGNRDNSGSASQLDERMPAGIWHALFKYASHDQQFSGWSMPAGVTEMRVCSPSGMLPSRDCPNIVSDVFLYGNEPTMPDNLFTTEKVNRETGLLATVFTPPDLVEERTFMNVPTFARQWAKDAGLELAPQGYDAIQLIRTDPDVNITNPKFFTAVFGKLVIRGTASGKNFASYRVQIGEGINPERWLQVGSSLTSPVVNNVLATWDTTGLNGLYAIRLSVIDRNNVIKTAITQVTVDNIPPTVRITYPQPGEVVEPVHGGITLNAMVEEQVGIEKVEWHVDGKLVLTQTVPPYIYQLQSISGSHKVYLKAWDTAGNMATSPEITFNIQK